MPLPTQPTVLGRLLEALSPNDRPYVEVSIRNLTAPVRRARIVAAGVHFSLAEPRPGLQPTSPIVYTNRTDFLAGPTQVSIGAGEAASFYMTDPRYAVLGLDASILARFGTDDPGLYVEVPFSLQRFPVQTVAPAPQVFEVRLALRARRTAVVNVADAKECFELVEIP